MFESLYYSEHNRVIIPLSRVLNLATLHVHMDWCNQDICMPVPCT